ncbi:hypothetical protein SDC9_158460 [bioreactor metagenome]|uniref:Uncharacterized protein n=1 Tax=bioreactor metagenome TaxID=1076179 RepID=A0A645FCS5_9ZZZZ
MLVAFFRSVSREVLDALDNAVFHVFAVFSSQAIQISIRIFDDSFCIRTVSTRIDDCVSPVVKDVHTWVEVDVDA